jgi:Ferritin-like domain
MQHEPTMTTPEPAFGSTRRQLIRTGAIGAAAAAFLAACGTKSDRTAGQSGIDPDPELVPVTAPPAEIAAADLAYDTDLMRTATSLELLAADLYAEYGAKILDPEWKANALRFGVDHEEAAAEFRQNTVPVENRVNEPNEWLLTNSVEPFADQLTNDITILDFFAALESTMAATYIAAVGSFTSTDGRARFAGFAEAAARRNALMANGGTGGPPTAALYPLEDLIPNEAYVTVTQATEGS